jgi:pyruvate/2-oxoglutarate dehydrogenase complex dihydrolipoamide acyltransferase (E2) component
VRRQSRHTLLFGIASDASAVDSGPVAYEFKLPDLGEGLTEGEIARWLVAEGQEIGEDDPLVEIQTDKTTVEIPSPAAGKVARILVAEGETVAVGTVLVVIGEANGHAVEAAVASDRHRERRLSGAEPAVDEQGSAEEQPAAPAVSQGLTPGHGAPGRVRATPLVRRLAQELGVDLETLGGSGPQGRVTEEDVRSAAASPGLALEDALEERREPLRGVRKLIAEHMARAHAEVPPVTWVEECDFGAVDLKRLVPLTLKAVAEALQEVPELNARLEGDEIVYLDRYDLGVAVQTDQGLVVPVVRDCDSRSVDELADEVARLAESARAHKLKPEELRGSTFTVTSAGKLGGLLTTPIVNHPEVGILSIGRVAERPVVRDGEIVARPTGTMAVTFDHRVVDGARAAEFGLAVIRRLETGVEPGVSQTPPGS